MQPTVTSTFALLGLPTFSLVAGLVIVTAVGAFIFGISHWQKPEGKAAAIVSGLVLVLFAVVIFCVLLTVWSGSMG